MPEVMPETVSDLETVQEHAINARMATYDLERRIRDLKAIAKVAEGLAGIMKLDSTITLNTPISVIFARNRAL